MKTIIAIPIIKGLFFTACGYFEGGLGGMNQVFADLENGIRKSDEELFKKHWRAEGYKKIWLEAECPAQAFSDRAERFNAGETFELPK